MPLLSRSPRVTIVPAEKELCDAGKAREFSVRLGHRRIYRRPSPAPRHLSRFGLAVDRSPRPAARDESPGTETGARRNRRGRPPEVELEKGPEGSSPAWPSPAINRYVADRGRLSLGRGIEPGRP